MRTYILQDKPAFVGVRAQYFKRERKEKRFLVNLILRHNGLVTDSCDDKGARL